MAVTPRAVITDLLKRGDFKDAAREAQKWHHAAPRQVEPIYWLALALMRMERPADAEKALDLGLRLQPHSAECLSLQGRAHLATGRLSEALATAKAAMTLNSINPEVWDHIGVVHAQLSQFVDALRAFETQRHLGPDSARLLFNLASMLDACHKVEEAEALYRQSLDLDGHKFIAYWSLAQLRRARPEGNHINWLLHKHAELGQDSQADLYLSMALAKQYEDVGDYPASFRWLERGNQIKRASMHYNSADDVALIDALIGRFSREFVAQKTLAGGCDSAEPIFIIGMPRTGTTLLEQIIASSDHVYAAGELHNFLAEWVRLRRRSVAGPEPFIEQIQRTDQLDFAALGRAYVDSTRPRTGHCRHFIDKLPNNFLYVGPILLALPNARILHVTRNPLDTCFANLKQLFGRDACPYSYDQREVARYFVAYRHLMDHWKGLFPGHILDVTYEHLVQSTEAEARRVFAHLELPWEDEALRFHDGRRPVGTASMAQVRQPIYTTSLDKWWHFEPYLGAMRAVLAEHGFS